MLTLTVVHQRSLSGLGPFQLCLRSLDLDCAVQLRDREMELKTQISAISSGSKGTAKAEEASGLCSCGRSALL